MRARAALLALLACTALVAVSAVNLGSAASPLLVWSNTDSLASGTGPRIDYEVVENVEAVVGQVVAAAFGKAAPAASGIVSSQPNLETVVVFVGSGQLSTEDLRDRTRVAKLADVFERAQTSVALPYTGFQGRCLYGAIDKELELAGIASQSISCRDLPSAVAAVGKALEAAKPQAGPRVLLVSAHVDRSLSGTAAGVEAELEQLLAVAEALEALEQRTMFVYASKPAASAPTRRVLQSGTAKMKYTGFGPYQECGQLCRVQVRWLEGMMALLVLALASCSGLTCLYMLDGPTRFEQSKESGAQQN